MQRPLQRPFPRPGATSGPDAGWGEFVLLPWRAYPEMQQLTQCRVFAIPPNPRPVIPLRPNPSYPTRNCGVGGQLCLNIGPTEANSNALKTLRSELANYRPSLAAAVFAARAAVGAAKAFPCAASLNCSSEAIE